VALADDLGTFRATASLRTLVPDGRPGLHLKLPLGITALGARRDLPVRYLANGDRGKHLLAAVARHPGLRGRVHVCDESDWWLATGGGMADGVLGCQLRRYPPALVADPGTALVPLAAFGVTVDDRAPAVAALAAARPGRGRGPGDDGPAAARRRGHPRRLDRAAGLGLLAALTTEMVRLGVVALAHGVMPEVHGQNVVVVCRQGRVAGLALRDHDAVRIHPPWLAAAGLPDPGYVVDDRTPNTLVAGDPPALLAWFQMLGVHVGLHPVARAVGMATGAGEATCWSTIADATDACLSELAAPPDAPPDTSPARPGALDLRPAVEVARHQLLTRAAWPVKHVLGPLLERGGSCGTSMPSAVGTCANPLAPARTRADRR
jgi:siderophore synthetase component